MGVHVLSLPGVEPVASSTAMESFLREYIAPSNAIHLVSIDPTLPDSHKGKIRAKWFGDDWEGAAQWAREQNSKPRNCYLTFNIRTPGDKKPTKDDIVGIRGFHADIDPPKGQPLDAWNKAAAIFELQMIGLPSFVIDTGRGFQPIWLASEGIADFEAVEAVNKAIQTRFKGDGVSNRDRLCRLPGSVNWGSPDKIAAGYQPRVASLAMPYAGRTVTLAEMTARFGVSSSVQASTLPAVITTGPVATWCGPTDDDELVRIMVSEKPGNMSKAFGDAAATRDLWEGNADMLAKSFPADGDEPFNHSAADAALCQKLGFYTGLDAVRMERLFKRSELGKRSKWKDRPDYRALTINKAIAFIQSKGGQVYRNEKYAPQVALNGEILPPVPVAADGFLNLSEQPTHFRGCVYVRSEHAVLIPTGELLTPERFNAAYGGHSFAMQADGASPSKKAFECFTENRALRFPQVATLDFDPERPFGDIRNDAVNIYMPVEHGSSEGGAIDTILEFYEHFIPDAVERDRHVKWMANKIIRPWERGCGVIFIAGDDHGTGRGLHFAILESLIGAKYTRGIKYRNLIGEGQGVFQDWKFRSLFVYVEEARNVAKTQSSKIAEYEELKENVDPSNFKAKEVARKTKTAVNARPFYSVILASNHFDAIWLHPDDRRFDVLTNGPRLSTELSDAVAAWLRNPANVAAWAEHLRSIDLTGYNSYEIPPKSAAKLAMIDGARSELDQAVSAAIEAIPGELFLADTVLNAVETTNISEKLELGSGWRSAARRMIKRYPVVCGKEDRLRITVKLYDPPILPGSPILPPVTTSRLVTVFAKSKELAAKWIDRDTKEIRNELKV